jgi:lipoate-protein ligase A
MTDDFLTIFDERPCHALAQDNMAYDAQLATNLAPRTRVLRLYQWKNRGITLGYKQQPPAGLSGVDMGKRVTGGGVVFHSPGDQIIVLAGHLNDPLWDKSLKSKLNWVRDFIGSQLRAQGISVTASAMDKDENRDFCRSYFSPYELSYHADKVVALTLRRFQKHFLIQGILHCSNGHDVFNDYSEFSSYFSRGLPESISLNLKTVFSRHPELDPLSPRT